ncbi:aromatic acid exporter family protein [Peribacillus frigoritolerans]|uniref:aromatic acid exporter family protein n=1 Tax=Peribacillus TaxID=2675229 RepID=UPI0007BEE149|nr:MULTISPECIES: aromatic acid exporter family protein [Peribacillus]MCZ0873284.1 aromatic acid exporter family protein [Peribacillus sp. AS_2]MDG4847305.1 aromatic acid exporter family protein [Peribacillus frigoritolerans]QNK47951.1 aromatic acid exporter family protein [Brevibacterium sp. PAMC23299]WHX65318.1 aromatic acid exporter family protein [Peribacillus frigoritolerans]
MFKIGYRTIKTALGATLAIIIAQMLNLEYFSAAGIIAILCIQVTKKKSVYASWHRFLACLIAMAYASLLFQFIAFHPLIIGLILLIFIPTAVALKINEGIVTSSVIIMHLYGSGNITFSLLINETILIAVGVGVALVMNLYMPSVDDKLLAYQESIETNFSAILMGIVRYLRDNDHTWDGKEITETANLLNQAKSLAFRDVENHFLREEDLYYHYFKMREKQFEIIERILPLVTNIPLVVKQSGIVADFIEDLAENVHPQNTAILYLRKLEEMEIHFRGMPLPQTREEFESRAALLQLMKEMERYLLLKHSFKGLPKLTGNRMKKRHLA